MAQEDGFYDPYMFEYKGVYFNCDLTTVEYIDSLEHFAIRDSDVFLVTYPKSGTVWTQQILSLIFNEGHRNGTEAINNITRVPWLEYNIYNMDYDNRPSPRLFSSHMPYYLMPKDLRNRRGKVIYVYRNPKDGLVSFYHFYKLMVKATNSKSWEEFFERFLAGKVFGGSWFDHVRGWHTHKDDFNILFMTYEEMKKDLRSAVLKISAFVEKELDDEDVNTIVEKATFENMKHDPLANYTFLGEDLLGKSEGGFLRKGTVGDWKNLMTVAQNERFDQFYKDKMKDLPIKLIWHID
ncbi:amine sulfotransferase-like [Spea bombifrons]|uniref:amine sulfotransferase-like n=1 Tax=Spea bombifrons TaxID=233779 RepID=UPI00234BB4E7|nr:amine sulfotransferase-like [Spea bombifrons]